LIFAASIKFYIGRFEPSCFQNALLLGDGEGVGVIVTIDDVRGLGDI
jgi:hypothetical protein